MKLMSFTTPSGVDTFGMVVGDAVHDLGARNPVAKDLAQYLARNGGVAAPPGGGNADYRLDDVVFLPVIPNPGKIICVGLNYSEHIAETGRKEAEHPALFLRTAASQCGHRSAIERPPISERLDYEGELALVIGKPGRNIGAANALDHVAGYACYNDVTVRDWQKHTAQWTPGKNFDGTGAFGPWMVTPEEIPPRSECRLTTRLNGQTVQQATLSQMVFTIEELIAYVSVFTELRCGDVIVTGTPGGVGDRRSPPLYMKAGDRVEVEVDGVGVLQNTIKVSGSTE